MTNVNDLKKFFEENVPLAPFTTFKIGGPARYFYMAKNVEEIKKAVEAAQQNNLSIFLLGNGSNILFSDEGFDGLVIKIKDQKLKIEGSKVYCGAGVNLSKLVLDSTNAGLAGMEWAIGIPGTIGGAIVGNAGAFGHSVAEAVEKAEALNTGDLKIRSMNAAECQFNYRESIFKKDNKYIILSAELNLKKGNIEESKKLIKEYLAKRQNRHPGGYPNAGSFFKNVSIEDNEKAFEKLVSQYPEAEKFRNLGTIPAAWLIEKRDLKGVKIGGAMVSDKHANFIVNLGKAKAGEVLKLINLCKNEVKNKFGAALSEEIKYLGF